MHEHTGNDGVGLQSILHPRASFWRRVWNWFVAPDIRAEALETIYLDLGDDEELTYIRPPLSTPNNRVEEEIRRRLNNGDGA